MPIGFQCFGSSVLSRTHCYVLAKVTVLYTHFRIAQDLPECNYGVSWGAECLYIYSNSDVLDGAHPVMMLKLLTNFEVPACVDICMTKGYYIIV
jgi:hypothetical protein